MHTCSVDYYTDEYKWTMSIPRWSHNVKGKKLSIEEFVLYDSTDIKFRHTSNSFPTLEVRRMVLWGMGNGWQRAQGGVQGALQLICPNGSYRSVLALWRFIKVHIFYVYVQYVCLFLSECSLHPPIFSKSVNTDLQKKTTSCCPLLMPTATLTLLETPYHFPALSWSLQRETSQYLQNSLSNISTFANTRKAVV